MGLERIRVLWSRYGIRESKGFVAEVGCSRKLCSTHTHVRNIQIKLIKVRVFYIKRIMTVLKIFSSKVRLKLKLTLSEWSVFSLSGPTLNKIL